MNSWDLEEIEALAYYIWERQGRPEGRSLENWQEAEELMRAHWLSATEDPAGHEGSDPGTGKVAE